MLSLRRFILFCAAVTCVGRAHAEVKNHELQVVWLVDPVATYIELFNGEIKEIVLGIMRKLRSVYPKSTFGMARHNSNALPCSTNILPLTPIFTEIEEHVRSLPMFATNPYDSIPFAAIYTSIRDELMGWDKNITAHPKKVVIYTSLLSLPDDALNYRVSPCGQIYALLEDLLQEEAQASTVVLAVVRFADRGRWEDVFKRLRLPHHVVAVDPGQTGDDFYNEATDLITMMLNLPPPTKPPTPPTTTRPFKCEYSNIGVWLFSPLVWIYCAIYDPD